MIAAAATCNRQPRRRAADLVPVEYIGKARVLRDRIARDAPRYEAEADAIIRPLRPRPAWPSPTRLAYLRLLATRYRSLRSPCRPDLIAKVDAAGMLTLNELRLAPGRVRFAGWEADEPSIRVTLRWVTCPPFAENSADIVEIGLHALARRIERGRPNDDAAVLRDVRRLARGYLNADDPSGEFTAETPSGRWIGAVAIPAGEGDHPGVLAVRTYVEGALRLFPLSAQDRNVTRRAK